MTLAHGIASETCPACAGLHRLRARNQAALRAARKHYLAALRAAAPSSLADLEEELKQTTAARQVIDCALRTHQSRQHDASPVSLASAA